ncbi:hypothetical protein KQ693_05710 [Thermus sp. PS18]|uniref:hypothetical protein n=1 Tax=Thermus sp. PS18 TaxID=2849039 RepID=UPI0022654D29|nr:hypothetical protein [Thermus sp. PS18]UZX16526.1 hypothetical protein KQ693_05710 [Thermus sp. PS18]
MARLLGYGIDTLVVNLYWPEGAYKLPEGVEDTLNELKDLYRRDPEGAIWWGVDAYFPLPNPGNGGGLFEAALVQSTRHYAWQLSFGGLVFVRVSAVKDTTRRKDFPAMRVEFTGIYMLYAGRDAQKVVQWVLDAAENLTGVRPVRVQVSRADLFVDLEGEPFKITDLDRFTSRSRVRGLYSVGSSDGGVAPGLQAGATPIEGGPMSNTPPATPLRVAGSWAEGPEHVGAFLRGRDWSGFTFGRGPLMARVYSKSVEAKSRYSARSLLKLYEETHGPITGEVIRVEFELTTEVLREMVVVGDGTDIRDWDTFLWAVPAIWAYLAGEWLVLRDKEKVDAYVRLRAVPVDPFWVLVQSAFTEGGGPGEGELVRDKVFRRLDPVGLAKQALGAFLTALAAASRLGKVDLKEWWIGAFRALGSDMEEREKLGKEAALAYSKALQRKLGAFGMMPEKWRFEGVPA